MGMTSTRWSPTAKRLVVGGLLILLLVALYLLRALIPPVGLAIVLAYLLKPLADRLERRTKWPRTAAVMLVFFVLLVVLSIIPVVVVPYVVNQVGRLSGEFQGLVADLERLFARQIVFLNVRFRLQDLFGNVQAALQNLLRPFATQTFNLLFGVASSLIWLLSVFVVSFYLVRDADRLRAFLDRMTPPGYGEEFRRLREAISRVWSQFFRGQLVLGFVVGMAVWIAMSIVGLPNAGLMGLIAGLLEVIPNFGPVLACIPALLTALLRGSTYLPLSNFWFMLLVLAIYVGIQQAENAYLVPRVMGRRLQVHPVLVFVGILAGGLLFGAIGVLLAAPVLGTLGIAARYTYAKLLDRDPFPPEPERVGGELYAGEIDAILLDLDGTLVETDNDAVRALAGRLERLRRILPQRDAARAARHVLTWLEGLSARLLGLLDRLGLDDEAFGLMSRSHRLRGILPASQLRPVEGAADLLRDLGGRYHLAIVTTRSHEEAAAFVAQLGLDGVIQAISGRDDTWRIKPHPTPLLHTARILGVAVDRCLMVGDTPADIRTARAAGARSVGVLCGFGSRAELERAGADLILEHTSRLTEVL
jgi:HAD superfamily hydrolase (TIGR01509 family)